ncbi:hypothetical protein J19TS2_55770 [Cohnella xylanilytica]|nr:hypothetical protein J19TS2_55770 [Cohnella xylanilytica]
MRFAYHLVGDYHAAEDAVQDGFAYLLVYPEKYDGRASFKTYLFAIVRNKCMDALRRRERDRTRRAAQFVGTERLMAEDGSGGGPSGGSGPLADAADDPERKAIVREQDREWGRRLRRLKPDDRLAIYLVDLEGLSYAQAAAIMRRGTVSFRVLLHRARKKLRQIYEKEEEDHGAERTGASVPGRSVPESPSARV